MLEWEHNVANTQEKMWKTEIDFCVSFYLGNGNLVHEAVS